ncbi:MAG: VOC family protein [Rhizobiales bacterium]|nr:VOC family protein [Rhizobacter sp.]
MQFSTYLFFDGRCEEAAAFYKQAIGAELVYMMRYSESPDPHPPGMVPPGFENKVMHMTLRIGEHSVMAADDCTGQPKFQGFSLSLAVKTEAEAEKLFAALGEGGSVTMPLTKTFFAPKFGMLNDRFGMGWMVMVGE